MIDLFDEFRDMLVELADAGAELAVVGGQDLADVEALERLAKGP